MFRPAWCTVVALIVTFAYSLALQAQNAPPKNPT